MGVLLTPSTITAWASLRQHVNAGCLCDPPGITRNLLGEATVIGGEEFRPILRTMRGSSALEGFHAHQKQWLGPLGRHAAEAGRALLADGALRWNRRRRNEMAEEMSTLPLVFAGGLLQRVDHLHQRLAGSSLYPGLARFVTSPPSVTGGIAQDNRQHTETAVSIVDGLQAAAAEPTADGECSVMTTSADIKFPLLMRTCGRPPHRHEHEAND